MKQPPPPEERKIYSVRRLNLEAQGLLEGSFPLIWLEAEISGFSRPGSGHWYLTLKDEQAEVRAAMFRGRNQSVAFTPRNGSQVLVRARVTLYVPRGSFQLVIEHMEEAGEGRLRRELEALKLRLQEEGLFASERKRPLPAMPRQIGVITSASGAAIRDVLKVLARRCPQIPVLIYPALVQGKEAPAQLRRALALANARNECDVLLLTRGGGSLEDLWAFNDEQLARDVAASAIPVVSAVGHEVDTSVTDLVADLRAPTPSAAAELLSPDMSLFHDRQRIAWRRLNQQWQRIVDSLQERLNNLNRRLVRPDQALQQHAQQLDELENRLRRQLQHRLEVHRRHLQQLALRLRAQQPGHQLKVLQRQFGSLEKRLLPAMPRLLQQRQRELGQLGLRLETASPLATLARGYSITFSGDQSLRSVSDLKPGDTITSRLADGELDSTINQVRRKDSEPSG